MTSGAGTSHTDTGTARPYSRVSRPDKPPKNNGLNLMVTCSGTVSFVSFVPLVPGEENVRTTPRGATRGSFPTGRRDGFPDTRTDPSRTGGRGRRDPRPSPPRHRVTPGTLVPSPSGDVQKSVKTQGFGQHPVPREEERGHL